MDVSQSAQRRQEGGLPGGVGERLAYVLRSSGIFVLYFCVCAALIHRPDFRTWWRKTALASESGATWQRDSTGMAFSVPFWTFSLVFLALDLAVPSAVSKFKRQGERTWKAPRPALAGAMALTVFNLYAVSPLVNWLLYRIGLVYDRFQPETLPTEYEMFRDLLGCVLVEEVLFYYSHRLLHWTPLYRRIHKIHHRFTAPMGFAATYAHPVEHVLSNSIPVAVGPMLMRAHALTACLWFAIAATSTVISHSGYDVWFLPPPTFHDAHHEYFNYNFGVLGILDGVHGTRHRPHVKKSL